MSTTSSYRTSAEECHRLARTARSEEERSFLKELEDTWLALAERNERIEQIGLSAVENALVPCEQRGAPQAHSS